MIFLKKVSVSLCRCRRPAATHLQSPRGAPQSLCLPLPAQAEPCSAVLGWTLSVLSVGPRLLRQQRKPAADGL